MPAEIGDDTTEGARGKSGCRGDHESFRHVMLRRQFQRASRVARYLLAVEAAIWCMHERLAGHAVLEPQPDLFNQCPVLGRMVGGEAVLKRRIARCIASFDRHAAGDPGYLGSVGLVAANRCPDGSTRRIGVENFRFRIQRIATEQWAIHRDVIEAENCPAAAVGLARHADQPLQGERADHQRALPRGRRGVVRVVMQHRSVQRVQRLVRIVLL